MDCDCILCIYQKDGKCTLDSISVNNAAMCTECIDVTIDEDYLEWKKEKRRNELEKEWQESEKEIKRRRRY